MFSQTCFWVTRPMLVTFTWNTGGIWSAIRTISGKTWCTQLTKLSHESQWTGAHFNPGGRSCERGVRVGLGQCRRGQCHTRELGGICGWREGQIYLSCKQNVMTTFTFQSDIVLIFYFNLYKKKKASSPLKFQDLMVFK